MPSRGFTLRPGAPPESLQFGRRPDPCRNCIAPRIAVVHGGAVLRNQRTGPGAAIRSVRAERLRDGPRRRRRGVAVRRWVGHVLQSGRARGRRPAARQRRRHGHRAARDVHELLHQPREHAEQPHHSGTRRVLRRTDRQACRGRPWPVRTLRAGERLARHRGGPTSVPSRASTSSPGWRSKRAIT
jgi:hypothetical protein